MTSKERLECALRGEKADRLGWAPEINDLVTKNVIERVAAGTLKPLSGVAPDKQIQLALFLASDGFGLVAV